MLMFVQHSLNKVGEEKINELPVSGNKRKHAETKHWQTDEQKQATLAKRREAYQKKKHAKLKSKDMQNLLNKEKILKREKHWRLMSKEKLNLQKEEKTIKREKLSRRQFLFRNKLHVTQTNVTQDLAPILLIRISI